MWVAVPDAADDNGENPVLLNNTIYIPLRSFAQSAGEEVSWDSKTRTVIINGQMNLGQGYIYDKKTGKLSRNGKIIGDAPLRYVDWIGLHEQKTEQGNLIITLVNTYGEPHIHDELYSFYVTNEGIYDGYEYYFQKSRAGYNILEANGKVAFTDKGELFVYNDATGELLINRSLGNDGYMVESIGKDFVLVRNWKDGVLTLVDFTTDKQLDIYKEILTGEDKEYVEYEDIMRGDRLTFNKQEGDILYFTSGVTPVNDKVTKYSLNYKEALNNPKITGSIATSYYDEQSQEGRYIDLLYEGKFLDEIVDDVNSQNIIERLTKMQKVMMKGEESQIGYIGETPVLVYREGQDTNSSLQIILVDKELSKLASISLSTKQYADPKENDVIESWSLEQREIEGKDSQKVLKLVMGKQSDEKKSIVYLTYNPARHTLETIDFGV